MAGKHIHLETALDGVRSRATRLPEALDDSRSSGSWTDPPACELAQGDRDSLGPHAALDADSDFSLQHLLWHDGERALYRGYRLEGAGCGFPILIAVEAVRDAWANGNGRLAHEYALKDLLHSDWAVRPLELRGGGNILLLEDLGGEPLARIVGRPMEMGSFLGLAVSLSGAVSGLHGIGLVHKDIRPCSIVVTPGSGQARLTRFGIASRIARGHDASQRVEVLAGALAYMAPEQAGRMTRVIDVRSDLYSLGVTLYELLTGALPFAASDPMEWIHCHMVRQPPPPIERVPSVPHPVSAIVMRLLAKAPEDRYQSASTLQADFQRCLNDWHASGRIEPFVTGADASKQLALPQKLYGREAESERLIAIFDSVVRCGTAHVVLVSGEAGIGKSALVHAFRKALPSGTLFAAGRFEAARRGVPGASLWAAFEELMRQLLSKNDADFAAWRGALHEALGVDGGSVADLIPESSPIWGDRTSRADSPEPTVQRSLFDVVNRFLGVFTRLDYPLILFLDDLQWLDLAALEVFESLATRREMRNLMLVGAYRNEEVGADHPLTHMLTRIGASGSRLTEIALSGIGPANVARMIADTLSFENWKA